MKKMPQAYKSKGKKKKGPMDLAELEEAHTDVTRLTNTDLAGASKMSFAYQDTDQLSEESGPSLKSAGDDMKEKAKIAQKKNALQGVMNSHSEMKKKQKLATIKSSSVEVRATSKSNVEIRGNELVRQLKSESKSPDRYPQQLVKNLIAKLKSQSADEYTLNLQGVEQLTDLVFYLLLTSQEDVLKKVVAVRLPGCLHVTDQGVIWMASVFTGLTKVELNGCHHVTETGLYQLIRLCKSLKEIQLKGTSVSILPKDIVNYDVALDGCPLISPERDIFSKGGFKLLRAPSYPKPVDEDIVKLCIINGSGSSKSLIKHLKVEYENELEPLIAQYNFKVRSNFVANIVECEETLSDLFITKRTLYMLSVQVPSAEAKSEAKRLFGLMCYIISKVSSAAFILAAVSVNGEKICTAAEIRSEMTSLVAASKSSLANELQILKQPEKLNDILFPEQESWKKKCVLSKALDNLYVDYCDVNMKQSYKEGDPLQTSIVKGMKAVCDLYPEFQEIAQPVFAYASSDSVQKILKDGVLSLQTAKYSNAKMMEFMAIMGKTCCASIVQDVPVVILSTWLAKVISLAYTPPPEVMSHGRVFGVSDEAPVWELTPLRQALEKVVGADQAVTGTQIIIKLGLSIHRNVVLGYRALISQPVIPVHEIFPDVANSKDKNLFSTVYHRLDFDFVVPNFILHKMMWFCSKLKRPIQAWQTGFIMQDACVETLIEIVRKDTVSCLNFCVHVLSEGIPYNEQVITEMIWSTLTQYRVIIHYILEQASIPYTSLLVTGKKCPPDLTAGLISYHTWKQSTDEPDNTTPYLSCKLCGDNSVTASLPWVNFHAFEVELKIWYRIDEKNRERD